MHKDLHKGNQLTEDSPSQTRDRFIFTAEEFMRKAGKSGLPDLLWWSHLELTQPGAAVAICTGISTPDPSKWPAEVQFCAENAM